MLNRNIAPEFKEISNVDIIKAKTAFLDNGIPIHSLLAGNESVIRLELVFKAGHWQEPFNGVSYFTTKLLSAGTSTISAKQLEEQIANYGAFLDLITGYDRCTVAVYTLSKHLEKLLPLLFAMVSDAVFPASEIENLKTISSQNLKVNLKKTSFLATKNFRELLFGKDHPYGRSIDETAIIGINQDVLKAYHKKKFAYNNCDIVIAGNGPENFHALINKYFGMLQWGNSQPNEATYAISNQSDRFRLINNSESLQSSIRMGLNLFQIDHPDYFKLNLLIEIFGGYFGSRLMKNIREEKGYTYGINASFNSLGHAGYMTIGTDVNKENTSNTIKEILKEMTILKTETVGQEELTTVTNYLLGSFVSSLSTPFGLADKFKTIHFHGLSYEFYNDYVRSLKEITSSELIETARTYFIEDNLLEVVAGSK